ncbi:CbtA family protein [Angustibacter luteus]|uniref:CbtA family protein n=1 Tax=Angustibacter luteus TaxID=658456 RepID=A0ABW1JBX0_9ACTN
MTRSFLIRGLLVGLLAGAVAFVVAHFLGEPSVASAIAVEESGHAAEHAAGLVAEHTHGEEAPLVSRGVQSSIGLLTALLLFGAALGGLFGIGAATAQGRLGRLGARATSALLALAGFVTVSLVPFLKYPANPPAVGDPSSIGRRSGLYFAMLALSVLFAVAAVWVARRLRTASTWNRCLAGVGTFVVLVGVAYAVLPAVDELGAFPADVLWRFRLGSLATQLAVWTTLGLAFGALTERAAASPAVAGDRPLAAV